MALENYRRSTDGKRLFQDANVEVVEVLYIPHAGSLEFASIGDNDPDKVGAICSVVHEGIIVIAVYQGDDEWLIVGGGEPKSIEDDSLTYDETSSTLNSLYPDMPIGGRVYSNSISVAYIKQAPTQWSMISFI